MIPMPYKVRLKLCLLPRICSVSKKSIWLKQAYRKRTIYGSYGGNFVEDIWYSKEEYIKARLLS
jgi:hypothetical protein